MRRIAGLVIFFQIFLFTAYGFSQTVTIIDVKGSAQVRDQETQPWQEAQPGRILEKNAELLTKSNSECTLAFDQRRKNVLTVKADSRIKIDEIIPAKIMLSEGRVFSLIKAISSIEKFEIKTPTATAGVRGSGLGVVFQLQTTSVFCFEDKIFIQGLDDQGNVTAEQELSEGLGINIGTGGILGESFALSSQDYKDWQDFSGGIERERQRIEEQAREKAAKEELMEKELQQAGEAQTMGAAVSEGLSLEESLREEEGQALDTDIRAISAISTWDGGAGSTREELREEERQSLQDSLQEEIRRQEEASASSGGGGGGGNSTTPYP
jgi:hypothetical protein